MRIKSILFITCCFFAAFANANNGFAIKTVVIDAGHGGKDPGALGSGKNNEKNIALEVALKVGEYIIKNFPDVKVIYTRQTDVFLELHERAEIANKAKADLFIAVHVNSSPNSEFYGTSSYVLGLHRTEANLEVAKRENAVILLEEDRDKNYEFDPNSPEGHIIMSMKQNAFLDQSINLASKIEKQYDNNAHRKSMGVKQAGFYVLYKTAMPSILTEIGFISNPEEEKFLINPRGQEQIANGIFNAFKEYKYEMEGIAEEKNIPVQEKENVVTKTETKVDNKTEVKTESKPEKNVAPSAELKTSQPVAKQEEPEKVSSENSNSVTLRNGKTVRKPVEISQGGGKATAVVEPVKKEEKKAEFKPEVTPVVKEEPKKEDKTENKTTATVEAKKLEPRAETKPEVKPVVKEEPKKEPKTENKPVPVAETKVNSSVIFKIQLFAVKSQPKDFDKISKAFSPISTELIPSGLTRYYSGNYTSIAEAKKRLVAAKSNGYPDAYLVGFKNGERLNAAQMQEYQ